MNDIPRLSNIFPPFIAIPTHWQANTIIILISSTFNRRGIPFNRENPPIGPLHMHDISPPHGNRTINLQSASSTRHPVMPLHIYTCIYTYTARSRSPSIRLSLSFAKGTHSPAPILSSLSPSHYPLSPFPLTHTYKPPSLSRRCTLH